MELLNDKEGYKYKVTEAEVKRARLGAFLVGNSLDVNGTQLDSEGAISVLGGNIALLEQLSEVTDHGVTHVAELRNEAAKTVRTGIEVLGLIEK
jgi:hypothetical protein